MGHRGDKGVRWGSGYGAAQRRTAQHSTAHHRLLELLGLKGGGTSVLRRGGKWMNACPAFSTGGAAAHLDEKCRLVEEPWRGDTRETGHGEWMQQLRALMPAIAVDPAHCQPAQSPTCVGERGQDDEHAGGEQVVACLHQGAIGGPKYEAECVRWQAVRVGGLQRCAGRPGAG